MCLAIPGQVVAPADASGQFVIADVGGALYRVNVDLLREEPPLPGEWLLIHIGFATAKVSAARAAEQQRVLAMIGAETETLGWPQAF
ncbi:MAG: HypC/HybG/HupF family hydrogenase formation chaperone [Vicinamibacterales bacterium]